MPSNIYTGGLWYIIKCSSNKRVDNIRITSANNQPVQLCGIKAYGYHNQSLSSATGLSFAIDTDKTGVPYTINKAGYVFNKPSSSWVQVYSGVADLAISPANLFWKLDRTDLKPYEYSSGSWVNKSSSWAQGLAVGPQYTWVIDGSNNIKRYSGSWSNVTGSSR
jgi:hypothetical protein